MPPTGTHASKDAKDSLSLDPTTSKVSGETSHSVAADTTPHHPLPTARLPKANQRENVAISPNDISQYILFSGTPYVATRCSRVCSGRPTCCVTSAAIPHIHRYHTNMEQFPLISWYVIWALSADNRILRLHGHTEVQRSICLRNIPIAFRMPTCEIAESLV